MPRNADGTWRNAKSPSRVSPAVLRARWIESEVIHLKVIGLSFDAIADEITLVGRGQAKPMVVIPPGVTFPPDYKISPQSCHERFKRAIARAPSLELEELRRLDYARSEEIWMNLQPGIRKGRERAIDSGVKVLDHNVKVHGYGAAPQRTPIDDSDDRLSIAAVRKILADDTIDVTSPPQPLIAEVVSETLPRASAPTGGASFNGDSAAPDDDTTTLPDAIEWSDIEIVREMLQKEEKMKEYLSFI